MATAESRSRRAEELRPPDWFLVELVRRANRGDFSIGLTLCVGGVVVSGTLVSGREYFEGFAEAVAAAARDPAVAERAREFFRRPAALYAAEPEGPDAAGEDGPPAYIHLKDARFSPEGPGVHWRGRLAAVDGFALGTVAGG